MREPKYKLNQKDEARWHLLLTRYCLMCSAAGRHTKRVMLEKYPPLNAKESAEFEALSRKRAQKVKRHPKVQEAIKTSRRATRRLRRLLTKLEKAIQQAEASVDTFSKTHETEL